jgi:hypothetical protein
MITSDVVDQACSEVNGYTDDRMMKEFDSFFKEQPSICDFITELTSESSMPIQELSLFLSYMVFKTMKLRNPETLPPIPAESIEAAYRQSETWIDRINQDDGKLLEDEEKGEVFFVLKTVISSLTGSPLGQEN